MQYSKTIHLFFSLTTLLFSSMAWPADTNPPPMETCSNCDVISAIKTVNNTLISGLGTTADSTGNVNPWLSQIFTALAGVNAGITYTSAIAAAAALNTIQSNNWVAQDAQTATQKNLSSLLSSSVSVQAQNSAKFASCVPVPGATTTSCNTPGTGDTKSTNIFSAGALLGNIAIDKNSSQYNEAGQLIQFLSDQGNQLLNIPDNLSKAQPGVNPKLDAFRASLGSYQALQSVGLNVFYNLLAERTKQQGLGKTAGIPGVNDASPLQVEAYAVQMPMNPEWIKNNVTKASMSDIAKQQLLLLVGIQNELFKIRSQLELLNATSAATQLEILQDMRKDSLDDLRSKAMTSQ